MHASSIDTADKTDYSKPSARRRYRKEFALRLKVTMHGNLITPKRHKVWPKIETRQVIESCQVNKGTVGEKRDHNFLDKGELMK
jgi:hypothetical protein